MAQEAEKEKIEVGGKEFERINTGKIMLDDVSFALVTAINTLTAAINRMVLR